MSIFYSARFERPFPVPLLAFERLANLADLPPLAAARQVLSEVCRISEPPEAACIYLLDRFKSASESAQELSNGEISEGSQASYRGLGTSFTDFFRSLDTSRILLIATGYDYKKAEYLYCVVDRDEAMQVVKDYLRMQEECNTYRYEAALYGFGGHYKNDDSSEDTIDMTDMDPMSVMKFIQG